MNNDSAIAVELLAFWIAFVGAIVVLAGSVAPTPTWLAVVVVLLLGFGAGMLTGRTGWSESMLRSNS